MVIITEEASSSTIKHIYDVFLSFRGADTRNNFTNHLYTALINANVKTFLDDNEIETGLYLKPELESAIRASRASIIVLSKNYASSTWCLNELVLILEQHRKFNHIVIPVFYHVEPTDVRKQHNSFGDAMADHKQKMEAETDVKKKNDWDQKMEIWKNALTQVANLKGKDARGRLETEFIEEIVTNILYQLRVLLNTLQQDPQLIGIDYSIYFLSLWLKDGSEHTADILTILGMGGIGKTSLAKHVYNLHCLEFTRSSFVENISRRCAEQCNGLLDVQKQLCNDISKASLNPVHDVSVYTSTIENALSHKKVLVILDDIDSHDQLDALLGNKEFYPGSKIIITTTDSSLTERCALFDRPQVQPKHTTHLLEGLHEYASLKLLCHHAFKCKDPKQGYEEVSDNIVKYCQGHPLALKVLGTSLHKKDLAYWEDRIDKLNKETDSRINNALRMSFDSLPSQEDKELFKHIACFFVGMDKDIAETILIACGMSTRSGIIDLMDRCLLSVGGNKKLMMHQLVQEMGRDAERQESRRRRLWCDEKSFEVFRMKKAKENIIGLALDMRLLEKEKFELKPDALSKMENLELLQLNYVKDFLWLLNFPEELRWLCMRGFPLKFIPSEIPMKNVVALDMSYSKLEFFDMSFIPLKGRNFVTTMRNLLHLLFPFQQVTGSSSNNDPLLGSLKILDLSNCYELRSVGGFYKLPSLQSLFLRNCTSLIEVSESIEHCDELVLIDLSYCTEFGKLPRAFAKLKKVKTLLLDGCKLGESPLEIWDLTSQTSSLASCFSSSLVKLSLANNNLSNESFPMDLSCLSKLTHLFLDGNPIVSMPSCVRSLPSLEHLSMSYCKMLMSIEHPPRTLTTLSLEMDSQSQCSIRKITFDLEMSPLNLILYHSSLTALSIEIEGIIKIQPITDVDQSVLRSLGWNNLQFVTRRHMGYDVFTRPERFQTQIYYEYGIFSTIYGGEMMPSWIMHRSKGSSVSFTIPPSTNKLTGLNICYMQTQVSDQLIKLPYIRISNLTKNRTWIYKHHVEEANSGGKCLRFLSRWMFGKNEMEDGDELTISLDFNVAQIRLTIMECGASLVYDNDDGKNEDEEDPLSYYKSWNHIIGGDLSPFQLETGEYFLYNKHNRSHITSPISVFHPLIAHNVSYKEKGGEFRAFSKMKSKTHGRALEGVTK